MLLHDDAAHVVSFALAVACILFVLRHSFHVHRVDTLTTRLCFSSHFKIFTFLSQADLSRCHSVDSLIGSTAYAILYIKYVFAARFIRFFLTIAQRPHQTLSSVAFSLGSRAQILLHSGHGLPCRRVSEAVLLIAPACAIASSVITRHAPLAQRNNTICLSTIPDVGSRQFHLTLACSAVIDRFLGKVVYKREYSGDTDWLLRRLRRSELLLSRQHASDFSAAWTLASRTHGLTSQSAWRMLEQALKRTA